MLQKSCQELEKQLLLKTSVPETASDYADVLEMTLGSMVENLTSDTKNYKDAEKDIKELLKKSKGIISHLNELVGRDAKAMHSLSQAYLLPQNTEEEKKTKEVTLQKAVIDATLVLMDIARYCLKAIELHEAYAIKGSRADIGNVGAGVLFCKTALQGAKQNILINIKIMQDRKLKKNIERQLREIESEGIAKADKILRYIEVLLAVRKDKDFLSYEDNIFRGGNLCQRINLHFERPCMTRT